MLSLLRALFLLLAVAAAAGTMYCNMQFFAPGTFDENASVGALFGSFFSTQYHATHVNRAIWWQLGALLPSTVVFIGVESRRTTLPLLPFLLGGYYIAISAALPLFMFLRGLTPLPVIATRQADFSALPWLFYTIFTTVQLAIADGRAESDAPFWEAWGWAYLAAPVVLRLLVGSPASGAAYSAAAKRSLKRLYQLLAIIGLAGSVLMARDLLSAVDELLPLLTSSSPSHIFTGLAALIAGNGALASIAVDHLLLATACVLFVIVEDSPRPLSPLWRLQLALLTVVLPAVGFPLYLICREVRADAVKTE